MSEKNTSPPSPLPAERCSQIEWLVTDVDGVMTDGSVILNDRGEQHVRFHIHDGLGVGLWHRAGKRFAMITGRNLESICLRGEQLQADAIHQGADDKLAVFEGFLATQQVTPERICYMGDDLPDLPVLRRVGVAVTVPEAPEEVRAVAHYVTRRTGGRGALREAIEMLLKGSGLWQEVVSPYEG